MEITYTIEKVKHANLFRVYKNVRGEHSIGSRKKFEGSYKECLDFIKKNNIKLKEVIKK